MAEWTSAITNVGIELLNAWFGAAELNVDRAAGGSGTVPVASLVTQTALVNQLQTGTLVRMETGANYRKVKIQFVAPTTGYTLYQIGVWASVDSGTSKLLAIFQHDEGVTIPSSSEAPNFIYTFYATLAVTNDGTATISIDSSSLVSLSTLTIALAEKQDIINALGMLKGNGDGEVVAAVPGVDYGLPLLGGEDPPDNDTPGTLGQHYITDAGVEYVLKEIINNEYHWSVVSGAKHIQVSLAAANWSAVAPFTQTVVANGIQTSGSDYIVTGSAEYQAAGVYMVVPAAENTLTFYADISKPATDLTADVLILETDETSSVYNVGGGQPRITETGVLKGSGNGTVQSAVGGIDYQDATQTLPAMTSMQPSDLVPFYNGTEDEHQKITVAQLKKALGVASPTIAVTTCSRASVTCTDGITTLTATGSETFDLPNIGTWTVSATLSNVTVSTTVHVTGVLLYEADLMIPASIAVTHAPNKTIYGVGENFDPTGLVVTMTYADNTTDDVTEFCTYSPSTMAANTTAVTISCTKNGITKTTTQSITVKTLSSIAVTTAPTKTSYFIGESFNAAGMVVTATYSNGSTAVVNGWTYSPTTAFTANSTGVTVSYTERGVTKTTTQAITIKQLSSIAVTTAPTKTAYVYGETFAPAGMVITATYGDGSTRTVTGYTYSPTSGLTLSDTSITISYKEGSTTKTATQAVTVANVLRSIAVTTPPTKTRYLSGQTFSSTGMAVTATYADGSTAVVNGWTYTPTTALSAGTTAVTVSYSSGGITKTATTPITVVTVSNVLNENSWDVIKQVAQEGLGANYWSVGDVKAVQINGTVGAFTFSGTYYCHIIGFNHNSSVEGIGIHFEFGKSALTGGTDVAYVDSNYFTTGSSDGFRMNQSTTRKAWQNSYMRGTICAQFLAALPSDLRNVIAATTKYTENSDTSGSHKKASSVSSTSDKIFLPAAFELATTGTLVANANPYEASYQAQYAYYANGNSITKYSHSSTSNKVGYWLRSPSGSADYIPVSDYGASIEGNTSLGFTPCFRVG